MAKKKTKIIIKLPQLEASVLVGICRSVADAIEYEANQDLRPLTTDEDLQIETVSNIYSQLLEQSHKMDEEQISKEYQEYENDYLDDQEKRAKLN